MNTALSLAGSLANIAVALTAVLALYLAWRQINLSRELSALEAYETYHMMCLEYPEFSTGNVPFGSFDATKLRCYEIYVLYTLMMGERIYSLFPKDAGWIFSIKDDIRLHKEFIGSSAFEGHRLNQGWTIGPLIDSVLAEDEDAGLRQIVRARASEKARPIELEDL